MSGMDLSETEGLRQRNVPVQALSEDQARQAVLQLNALEEKTAKDEGDKKTYGRTPDGTIFTVPATHDMVSQLLSPTEPKNVSDFVVIAMMALHVILLCLLPRSVRVPILASIFLFWRASYNAGIGWLLQKQSHQQTLVRWAKLSKVFGKAEDCPHPKVRRFIKRELETKVVKDYSFDTAPIEYNAWLLFRRLVDLVLMCDFTSYTAFAIACAHVPQGESLFLTATRWVFGISLFLFNLWVKLDAHRVVKDFAWYWGDFFFLVDQELTFDGVFEMAPHPMYSIGYAGYYGISLMAASYKVLFISILAHGAQFAFLSYVENPHIERTYNSPPPRRQVNEPPKSGAHKRSSSRNDTSEAWPSPAADQPPATHNLLGLQNLDLYRITDTSIIVIQFLMFAITLSTPNTRSCQALFVANAALWRVWYSLGLGYLLNRQSNKKKWTRHFLKYGESTGEAWRQWKGTYHMSMILCYTSFVAAAWKMYLLPSDWEHGLALLKHVIGSGLITLQIWVSVSIYDQLGEFGWFFGDFFFDHQPKLTYGGIYRFLNNPERFLGLAGVWGVALITNSAAIFCLALLSHTMSLLFIQFVERPHMQKLYGRNIRQDSGLVRSLRRSLPPPLRQWQDGMDKMLGEALDTVEDFLDEAKPKLEAKLGHVVQDTRNLFTKYPARITVTRIEPEIVGLDPQDYALEIEQVQLSNYSDISHTSRGDGGHTRNHLKHTREHKAMLIEYGTPIRVKWTAPASHGKKDWIGLYMVADNVSREVTRIVSQGRWIATNAGEYDSLTSEIGIVSSDVKATGGGDGSNQRGLVTGEMVFSGDKLWWTQGAFEFRYHHNSKHNVMATSVPFEVCIPRFTEDDLELDQPMAFGAERDLAVVHNEKLIRQSIESTLLPIVQNCFDRDADIAPHTPQETFGGLVERDGKFARRVVYAILQTFGVEFAPEVVKADGKVENLAWRILEAKKVLAPYSMSKSRGTSTPAEEFIQ